MFFILLAVLGIGVRIYQILRKKPNGGEAQAQGGME